MKRLICLTAMFSLFCVQELWAWNFNMISVDTSSWPEVDVVAALPDGNVNAGAYTLRLTKGERLVEAAYISGPLPSDPINLLVAVDTCRSMSQDFLKSAKEALMEYVDYLDANERMAVIAFNEGVDMSSAFMGDRRTFREFLENIEHSDKETRLYLNLLYGIDLLKNRPGRRHLLLLADADDKDDGLALQEVLQNAREHNVKISTVTIPSISGGKSEDTALLQELAAKTGGFHHRAYSVDEVQSGVYGLLDQQRSLARGERRHLYKIRFNMADGGIPRGVLNADLIRTDGRDIRFVNFYLPRPANNDSAVWEKPNRVSMSYGGYQTVSAAPPAGDGESRPWYKPMFWLGACFVLAMAYWLWRRRYGRF